MKHESVVPFAEITNVMHLSDPICLAGLIALEHSQTLDFDRSDSSSSPAACSFDGKITTRLGRADHESLRASGST